MKFDLIAFHQNLCTNIIPYLEKKYFDSKSFRKLNIIVPELDKSSHSVRIIFPEKMPQEHLLVLRYLEKIKYLQFRIATYGNVIIITEDEAYRTEKEELMKLVHSFLSCLADKVRDLQVTFELISPLTLSIVRDPIYLRLKVRTPKGADALYRFTCAAWEPRLEGDTIVHLRVPRNSMKRYSEGDFLMRRTKQIIRIGSLGIDFPKVIPFETVYGKPLLEREGLNQTEQDVLLLICRQCTPLEISNELRLSVKDVEECRDTLLIKISARNDVGLVIYAIKSGLFSVTDETTNDLGMLKDVS